MKRIFAHRNRLSAHFSVKKGHNSYYRKNGLAVTDEIHPVLKHTDTVGPVKIKGFSLALDGLLGLHAVSTLIPGHLDRHRQWHGVS